MTGNNRFVYWDSCCFIEWAKAKQPYDKHVMGLMETVDDFNNHLLTICTSTLTIAEVLKSGLNNPSFYSLFTAFIQRSDFELIAVTDEIAHTAHEIRDYFAKNKDKYNKTIATPDAIHLATSIERECEVFYTFDSEDKGGKKPFFPLVPLSGSIANRYFMEIKKPFQTRSVQGKLPFQLP